MSQLLTASCRHVLVSTHPNHRPCCRRRDGPHGFRAGSSAGLHLGKHPMSHYHGGPRRGTTPHDGPRHGSPSRHHSPGPHSGPGRHHRERHHHSPGSHLGSDHHVRRHHHSHSPGRHAGPGGHYRDRVGGGPWGRRGRPNFTGPSGLHLLRQHQGEGSVPIKMAESQEGYLIFAGVYSVSCFGHALLCSMF